MSQRLNDFLAREAGEYLAQMEALLRAAPAVDPEQLLRLARGVRGSAQMAGSAPVAALAQRLEQGARAVADGRAPWTEEIRSVALRGVEDLKLLLRGLGRWGEEDEARFRAALQRLERLPGGRPAVPPPAPAPPAAPEAVPIEALLLRGDDALREALALRPRLEAEVARGGAAARLLDELFDLIRLARSNPSAPE